MAEALFLTGMALVGISVFAENVRTILDGSHPLLHL